MVLVHRERKQLPDPNGGQTPFQAAQNTLIPLALAEFLTQACERQEVTCLMRIVFAASGFIERRYQQFLETGRT